MRHRQINKQKNIEKMNNNPQSGIIIHGKVYILKMEVKK